MLDTNVVIAAMRSPTGASAELLQVARRSEVTLLANVALEYEATGTRKRLSGVPVGRRNHG